MNRYREYKNGRDRANTGGGLAKKKRSMFSRSRSGNMSMYNSLLLVDSSFYS